MVSVTNFFGQDEYCEATYGDDAEARQHIKAVREQNTQILAQLVEKIVAKKKGHVSEREVPYHVFEALLAELKTCEGALDLSVYPARQRCYAKWVVYNHKDNGSYPFCFTLIVLGPGQKTPKHSHKCDCAPICIKGVIEETLYRENPPAPGKRLGELQVLRKTSYRPYQGGYLLQEQPNVHHLENRGSELAMSLHLYVFDAEPDAEGRVGSSVLHVYP